jgi:hypothetical protein
MSPAFDREMRFGAESNRIVTSDALIFLMSQTLTVRSSDPDTSFSSLVKTALVTLLKQTDVREGYNLILFESDSTLLYIINRQVRIWAGLTQYVLGIRKQNDSCSSNPTFGR